MPINAIFEFILYEKIKYLKRNPDTSSSDTKKGIKTI